jgi:NAD(P)-dependent dehydrogenase (short-subunit alcohol dehydrogenase family)
MTKSQELIVVSGASSGMGRATALELARRGYQVLAGVRSDEAAARMRLPGVEPVMLDITRPSDIDALVARIDGDPEHRPLHALVNSAGLGLNGPVEALPLDTWRRMFDVNLFGHIAMTQALLPALRHGKGRVINISSTGGRIAMPAFGA